MPTSPDSPTPAQLDLAPAFRIAVAVHGSQRDKSGAPYMGHICRVMDAMGTDIERVVAILHDSIEDCKDSTETIADIHEAYGQEILDIVALLTHYERDSYEGYLREIAKHPIALKVKISDCLDNSNHARLAKLPLHERARLKTKYGRALDYLRQADMSQFNKGEHLAQISDSHQFFRTPVLPIPEPRPENPYYPTILRNYIESRTAADPLGVGEVETGEPAAQVPDASDAAAGPPEPVRRPDSEHRG